MRDTLASVLALHVADIIDGLGDATPLGSLERHDSQHGSDLVATAKAFSSTAVTWRILLPHCMFTPTRSATACVEARRCAAST
ncbi:hypothetical protein GCM10020255_060150 [Rhodococcus baikonurensis]